MKGTKKKQQKKTTHAKIITRARNANQSGHKRRWTSKVWKRWCEIWLYRCLSHIRKCSIVWSQCKTGETNKIIMLTLWKFESEKKKKRKKSEQIIGKGASRCDAVTEHSFSLRVGHLSNEILYMCLCAFVVCFSYSFTFFSLSFASSVFTLVCIQFSSSCNRMDGFLSSLSLLQHHRQ